MQKIILFALGLIAMLLLLINLGYNANDKIEPNYLNKQTLFENNNGGASDFTHSFWLSIDQIHNNSSGLDILTFNDADHSTKILDFVCLKNKFVLKHYKKIDSSPGSGVEVIEHDIILQRWNHIVIVQSGHDLDLYINGILVATREIFLPSNTLNKVETFMGTNENDIDKWSDETQYSVDDHDKNIGRYFKYTYYSRALMQDEIKGLATPIKKLANEGNDENGYKFSINISKGTENLGGITF